MEYPPNKTVTTPTTPRNRQHELLWYYQQQQQLAYPTRPITPQSSYPYVDINSHWAVDNHAANAAMAPTSGMAPASRDARMSMQIMKRERLVKFKTELCKNYTNKHVCPFYTSCSFGHGESERRRNPVSPFAVDYRPELCKDGTKDNNYCLNNNELYYHPENYKTQYCKSAQTGEACARPLCAMAHNAAELKSKPNTNTLAYMARYQMWDKIREKLDLNPQDTSLISPPQSYQFTRETALHYCAKYGQVELCRRLILLGADVNAKDWKEQTPLHKLCAFGGGEDVATAKLLLEMGANKAALDTDGSTPSNFAAKANHTHLLTLLSSWNDGQWVEPTVTFPEGNEGKDSPLSAKISSEGNPNLDGNEDIEPPLKRFRPDPSLEPKSDGSTQIKIKYENKLKLTKLPPNCTLAILHAQIKGKLSINSPYYLTYFDPEGDNITIEDEDDLRLFLGAANPKKILEVNLGTATNTSELGVEDDSGSQGEVAG